jgi:hypothetical protein
MQHMLDSVFNRPKGIVYTQLIRGTDNEAVFQS